MVDHDLDLPQQDSEAAIWNDEWETWADELEAVLYYQREDLFGDRGDEELPVGNSNSLPLVFSFFV
jgi:hypothetical protein